MGRAKTYDREALIDRAMMLFWRQGYQATTAAELVTHLEVNKFSLYSEFGSKQALYDLALERYDRDIVSKHFRALESDASGVDDIVNVLGYFARRGRTAGSDLGCFMCNCATEMAPHDLASQHRVEAFTARVAAACRNALVHARARGELCPDANVEEEASWLATTLMGLFVLMRAQIAPETLIGAGRAAQRHVLSLLGKSTIHGS